MAPKRPTASAGRPKTEKQKVSERNVGKKKAVWRDHGSFLFYNDTLELSVGMSDAKAQMLHGILPPNQKNKSKVITFNSKRAYDKFITELEAKKVALMSAFDQAFVTPEKTVAPARKVIKNPDSKGRKKQKVDSTTEDDEIMARLARLCLSPRQL